MPEKFLNYQKQLDYLYSRGLTAPTIKAFDLGGCDTTGKCSHEEYIPLIDYRFYDSVLFPIKDLYNNLVAVASRSIDTKKYIHSKYSKKRHLFGLNVTYKEILKTRKVYVVEGNFDLLTLYENGIKNGVAMLGSKLSLEQISLLTRFAEEIIIATDGDKAGRECTIKLSKTLEENNIAHRKLILPLEQDPDSFIREYGTKAFLECEEPTLQDRIKRW